MGNVFDNSADSLPMFYVTFPPLKKFRANIMETFDSSNPIFMSLKKVGVFVSIFSTAIALFLLTPLTARADSSNTNQPSNTVGKNWLVPLEVDSAGPLAASTTPTAYCRFGINMNTQNIGEISDISNYDISSLGVGWYIDYQAQPFAPRPNNVEYAPMIRVKASNADPGYTFTPIIDNLTNAIANNPGADWFIGNEPDRKDFQDGVEPEIYAKAYHDIYDIIKTQDPTAQIFAGSIVQPTEVRLEYLDAILASYQSQFGESMPVDGWSIHNFILNEADCAAFNNDLSQCWGADMPPATTKTEGMRIGIAGHKDVEIFKQQVVRFRQWMTNNGYGGKPVYLSEYGILLPDIYGDDAEDFSPASVNQFMNDTFDYMLETKDPALGDPNDDYRLIQRFSWYSVNDDRANGGQYNGNLFSASSYSKSSMGQNYSDYTANLADEINIYMSDVELIAPAEIQSTSTDPITYTVRMTVANSGNLLEKSTVTMQLYDDELTSGGQQIVPEFDVTLAGCGDHVLIETEWLVAPASAPTDAARFRAFINAGDINTYMPLINK